MSYLGLDLIVPESVFAPTPVSDLLGTAVLDEARESDRVLDMGTGYGVNAILAAHYRKVSWESTSIRMPWQQP